MAEHEVLERVHDLRELCEQELGAADREGTVARAATRIDERPARQALFVYRAGRVFRADAGRFVRDGEIDGFAGERERQAELDAVDERPCPAQASFRNR